MISPIGIYHDDESRKAEKESAALAYGGIENSGKTMLKEFRKISKDCDMKLGTRMQKLMGNAKCPVAPRRKRTPGMCRMKICPKLFAVLNGPPVEGPKISVVS